MIKLLLLTTRRHPFEVYAGFRLAPRGISPFCRKRHSAIASLRASATMPTRRIRAPECANRRLNQSVNALVGWRRSQPKACSTSRARTRLQEILKISGEDEYGPDAISAQVTGTAPH